MKICPFMSDAENKCSCTEDCVFFEDYYEKCRLVIHGLDYIREIRDLCDYINQKDY